jgi:hypothetical protein
MHPVHTRLLLVLPLLALTVLGCAVGGGGSTTVTVVVTPTPTPSPSPTSAPAGKITGHLGYPASQIPPLAVYAISTTSSSVHFKVTTAQNQMTYTIAGVSPGTYHVVAYRVPDQPALRGGYSQFVLCGNAAGCPSHALVAVVVHADATVSQVNPTDWYAPAGTFPPPPS